MELAGSILGLIAVNAVGIKKPKFSSVKKLEFYIFDRELD
jgi:hypothetical protein